MPGRTLIIEGAELSGKSTLSNRLATNFPFRKRIHTGGPIEDLDNYQIRMAMIREEYKLHPLILDRIFHASHWVYALLRDKDDPMRFWEPPLQDLTNLDPVFVYCRPQRTRWPVSEEAWVQSMTRAHKPEDFARKTWEWRHEIREAYDTRMAEIRKDFSTFVYDYTDPHANFGLWTYLQNEEIIR